LAIILMRPEPNEWAVECVLSRVDYQPRDGVRSLRLKCLVLLIHASIYAIVVAQCKGGAADITGWPSPSLNRRATTHSLFKKKLN
jgi:hypothetical protein